MAHIIIRIYRKISFNLRRKVSSIISTFIMKTFKKGMAQTMISARLTCLHSVAAMLSTVNVYAFIYGILMVEISTELLQLLDTQIRIDPAKFITFWNMVLQSLYFSLVLFIDLMGLTSTLKSNQSQLIYIRDFLFASWVLPIGTWVCSSFWLLYWVNSDLILPERLALLIPSWVNHMVHTLPAVFAVMELWLVPHKYPTRRIGLQALTVFMAAYFLYMIFSSLICGKLPYPILNELPFLLLIVVLIALSASAILHYIVGDILNTLLWDVTARKILANNVIYALATPPSSLISIIFKGRELEVVEFKSETNECRNRRHRSQSVQYDIIPQISITPSPDSS